MPDSDYAFQALARRTALASLVQPPVIQPMNGGIVQVSGGTLIDKTGVISAFTIQHIATSTAGSGQTITTTNTTPATDITGTAVPFTLSRAASIAVVTSFAGSVSGTPTGVGATGYLTLDGTSFPGSFVGWDTHNTGVTSGGQFFLFTASGGEHTVSLGVAVTAGTLTWTAWAATVDVYLFGS